MGVRKHELDDVGLSKTSDEMMQAVVKRRRKLLSEVVAPKRKISALVDQVATNLSPDYKTEVAEYRKKIAELHRQRSHGDSGSGQLSEVVDALKCAMQQNNKVMADLASAVQQLTSYLQRGDGAKQMSGSESTGRKPREKK